MQLMGILMCAALRWLAAVVVLNMDGVLLCAGWLELCGAR